MPSDVVDEYTLESIADDNEIRAGIFLPFTIVRLQSNPYEVDGFVVVVRFASRESIFAASCWAQAGNVYQAIAMCHELLEHPDVPQRLRQRVEEYLRVLQARREQWVIKLVPDLASAVPPES